MARMGDEFNSVSVSNEKETFSRFEFGQTQNVEYSFYKDNTTKVKSELNETKAKNSEKLTEAKDVQESSGSSKKLLDEKDIEKESGGSSSGSESSSSSASSGGASSSSAAASSSGAAVSGASIAATVGAVAVAIPAVMGISTLTTVIKDTQFKMGVNEITYVVDMVVDENDTRDFDIFISNPKTGGYEGQLLDKGYNEGVFDGLQEDTTYLITILGYGEVISPDNEDALLKAANPKLVGETYSVDVLPEGDVMFTKEVVTKAKSSGGGGSGGGGGGDKQIQSISVNPDKLETEYGFFDELDLSTIEVIANYSDGSTSIIDNSEITFTYSFTLEGEHSVGVIYGEFGTSFNVMVSSHVSMTFDGKINSRTGELAVNVSKLLHPDVVNSIDIAIDGTPLDVAKKLGDQTLTIDATNFDFDSEHNVTLEYYRAGYENSFTIGAGIMKIEDSYVKKSEINAFNLGSSIDHKSGPDYYGTGLTSFAIDYVDDFGYFSDFTFELKATDKYDESVTYVLSYVLDSDSGFVNLVDDADVKSGDRCDISLLTNNTFDVTLHYTHSQSGEMTFSAGQATFSETSTTDASISIPSSYYIDDGYCFNVGISLTGFDSDLINGATMQVTSKGQTPFSFTASSQTVSASKTLFTFQDSEFSDVGLEDCEVKISLLYGDRSITLYNADASFREGQQVFEETTILHNQADFDTQTVYVTLDYEDAKDQYSDFELELYSVESSQYHHTYSLTKQTNKQAVSIAPGNSDGISLSPDNNEPVKQHPECFQFSYYITYLDANIPDRQILKNGYINFSKIVPTFSSNYDDPQQRSSVQIFNLENIITNEYPDARYSITLTHETDSDKTHTWTIVPTTSEEVTTDNGRTDTYILDFSGSEFSDWTFQDDRYLYEFSVYQPTADTFGQQDVEYETVTYQTGTVTYPLDENCPIIYSTDIGNPYKAQSMTSGGNDYYLPVAFNIYDPYNSVQGVFIAFGQDDGTSTPVDYTASDWSTNITDVQLCYPVQDQSNGELVSGWRNINITELMERIYTDGTKTYDEQVTDGDDIKCTFYMMCGTDYIPIGSGVAPVVFTETEMYGASVNNGGVIDGSGLFSINIAEINNNGDIAAIDYIGIDIQGEDYYVSSNFSRSDTTLVNVNLSSAKTVVPTEVGDQDFEQASEITQEQLDEILALIATHSLNNPVDCYITIFYHYQNDTELQIVECSESFHFIVQA